MPVNSDSQQTLYYTRFCRELEVEFLFWSGGVWAGRGGAKGKNYATNLYLASLYGCFNLFIPIVLLAEAGSGLSMACSALH